MGFAYQRFDHWEFVSHRGENSMYSWRHVDAEGKVLAASSLFPHYGKAVRDALSQGFLPRIHHWVNISSSGDVIHYAPGKPAAYVTLLPRSPSRESPFQGEPVAPRKARGTKPGGRKETR